MCHMSKNLRLDAMCRLTLCPCWVVLTLAICHDTCTCARINHYTQCDVCTKDDSEL